MPFKTIIEPFKIKTVEPIRWTTREAREQLLQRAHYNLFLLPADAILIDLLTDSGTAASSSIQNPKSKIRNFPAWSSSIQNPKSKILPGRSPGLLQSKIQNRKSKICPAPRHCPSRLRTSAVLLLGL